VTRPSPFNGRYIVKQALCARVTSGCGPTPRQSSSARDEEIPSSVRVGGAVGNIGRRCVGVLRPVRKCNLTARWRCEANRNLLKYQIYEFHAAIISSALTPPLALLRGDGPTFIAPTHVHLSMTLSV
jgi:hypothetical protein